jgi:hypothetical protein
MYDCNECHYEIDDQGQCAIWCGENGDGQFAGVIVEGYCDLKEVN